MDDHSSWANYVNAAITDETNPQVAARIDVDKSTVGRWRNGTAGPKPSQAVAFARAYDLHPLSALLAADFLTSDEIDVMADRIQMPRKYTLDDFTTSELAAEVYRRVESAE